MVDEGRPGQGEHSCVAGLILVGQTSEAGVEIEGEVLEEGFPRAVAEVGVVVDLDEGT